MARKTQREGRGHEFALRGGTGGKGEEVFDKRARTWQVFNMTPLHRPALFLIGSLLTLTAASHAAITVVGNFRLGETDPGAVAGSPAGVTTDNAAGLPDLALLGVAPVYTSATGVSGSSLAMDFNGGGYVSAPLITTNNNWGVEAWVRGDSGSAISAIVYNGNSANAGMGIYQFNGDYIGLMGGITFVGATPVTANWTHLAMVVDNGVTTFYVNGVANASAGMPNVPAGNFNVGVRADGAELFDGRIDEVRVFNFAPGQFSVNDLQLTGVVPEPGTAVLLAGGVLALGRRRRKMS
jgi:hypothetical protein